MAKTVAERQAAYRKGRAEAGENGERRLNTWVSTGSSLALDRLAKRYGVTKREMIERLVLEADQKIVGSFDPDSREWGEYFSVTQ